MLTLVKIEKCNYISMDQKRASHTAKLSQKLNISAKPALKSLNLKNKKNKILNYSQTKYKMWQKRQKRSRISQHFSKSKYIYPKFLLKGMLQTKVMDLIQVYHQKTIPLQKKQTLHQILKLWYNSKIHFKAAHSNLLLKINNRKIKRLFKTDLRRIKKIKQKIKKTKIRLYQRKNTLLYHLLWPYHKNFKQKRKLIRRFKRKKKILNARYILKQNNWNLYLQQWLLKKLKLTYNLKTIFITPRQRLKIILRGFFLKKSQNKKKQLSYELAKDMLVLFQYEKFDLMLARLAKSLEKQKKGHFMLIKNFTIFINLFKPVTITTFRLTLRGKLNSSKRRQQIIRSSEISEIAIQQFKRDLTYFPNQSRARASAIGLHLWIEHKIEEPIV